MAHVKKLSSSFHWLNTTQLLGAFNDNLFKLLVIYKLITLHGASHVVTISAIAGTIFVLPFLLFSPLSGMLADRYKKQRIIRISKTAEIGVMLTGLYFFYVESTVGLYGTLFLMSLQSVFFGPAKLGILPEIADRATLAKANGIIMLSSYGAIILGTSTAALISIWLNGNYAAAALCCIIVACAGTFCSMNITTKTTGTFFTTKTPSDSPSYGETIKTVFRTPAMLRPIIGSALFLFIGAFIQLSIIPYGMSVLELTREASSWLFLFAALGIGIGSFTAGQLSRRGAEAGICAAGTSGIVLFSILTSIYGNGILVTSLLLIALGFSGGLFIVPVNTIIQSCAGIRIRGKVLSISYFLNFSMVLIAALFVGFLGNNDFSLSSYFFVTAAAGMILLIGVLVTSSQWLARFFVALFIRCFYRFKVNRDEHVPIKGAAIILFNHVSWIDGLFATASIRRPIHFLMKRQIFETPLLKQLFRAVGIIPISYKDGPHTLTNALESAAGVLQNGGIIGLFPEGAISHDGFLLKCRNGFKKCAGETNVPIVPAYINGAWGSCFSYYGGKLFSQIHLFARRPVSVTFGKPLAPSADAQTVRNSIEQCGTDSFFIDKNKKATLATEFISSARKNWRHDAMNDTTGKRVHFGNALIAASMVADYIHHRYHEETTIGIMLPASVGGALVNIAVALSGKSSVNLNFTASASSMESAVRQCGLKTIITSRLFLKKLKKNDCPFPFVYIEDIMKTITPFKKITTLIKAFLVPVSLYTKRNNVSTDDCATVIFSSGSTAEPKGIMLSHFNILSNVESMRRSIAVSPKDTLCAALPLFHSFGFTATVWFPVLCGFKVSYHPNPLEGEAIAKLVHDNHATILLATPTFLRTYIKKATPQDFSSLKLVITGAEKCRKDLADRFSAKFNKQPLEGYGTTELSPVVSLNIPDSRTAERRFTGTKSGTVGRALPGISVKVVCPKTGAPLRNDRSGLLCVKGPNVMTGYLGLSEKTGEVINNGWYITGDIASIDDEGFITLTDRLSRFSKIGGEMVPHGAVEDALCNGSETDTPLVVVTSVADEMKGEKLVVIYTPEAAPVDTLIDRCVHSGLPNLWRPNKQNYLPISEIPLLGTGKTDLKAVKNYAEEHLCKKSMAIAA